MDKGEAKVGEIPSHRAEYLRPVKRIQQQKRDMAPGVVGALGGDRAAEGGLVAQGPPPNEGALSRFCFKSVI